MQGPGSRAVLLTALVLLVGLAGCSGKGSAQPSESIAPDERGTATTGVIRGVVVDGAFHTVAEAAIAVSGSGKPVELRSDAAGRFTVPNLAPGIYTVRVTKAGYSSALSTAEVKAGDFVPDSIKVQILADPASTPAVDVFHFTGYIECNVVAGPFFMPCEAPFVGPVGQDDFSREFNLTGNVRFVQAVLVWTPTYPGAEELYANVYTGDYNIVGYGASASPLVISINKTADAELFSGTYVGFEVSSNGVGGLAGGAIEQTFDAYIVVTHNFAPPAGYLFTRDGEPKVPQ